jgi:hypothetical protein
MTHRIAAFFAAAVLLALALPSLAQGTLVRVTGQLLDVRNGFVYFTSGDAFKLAAAPRIADYDTGKPTTLQPRAKLFARAIIDPATKQVVELDLTTRHLPDDASYATVAQQFALLRPTSEPAPEIVGQRVTGKEVPVTFTVTVPRSTRTSTSAPTRATGTRKRSRWTASMASGTARSGDSPPGRGSSTA